MNLEVALVAYRISSITVHLDMIMNNQRERILNEAIIRSFKAVSLSWSLI